MNVLVLSSRANITRRTYLLLQRLDDGSRRPARLEQDLIKCTDMLANLDDMTLRSLV